ncbi:MAG: DUF6516 family protein [Proteobacteria bacterium]|nr:DUF6516 family protein [Pseudomonadota bacterium]MDA1057662.1 DUF6516 family protein [Pseudomonadota bacterium]
MLLLKERVVLDENRFADLVVWRLPEGLLGSRHAYKYRLAFVVDEVCIVRFDNEAGTGDHMHIEGVEIPYDFRATDDLLVDFRQAVLDWRP